MRWKCLLAAMSLCLAFVCAGCSDDDEEVLINVSGTAFGFSLPGSPYTRIENAEISILEMPGVTATTTAEGEFAFEGLPASSQATFLMRADGFPPASTKTFTLPEEDLERVTFQIPPNTLMDLIASNIGVELDENRCQLVSTVTVVGRSLFDSGAHGEPGALVSSDPFIPEDNGPIYFNEAVFPDYSVTASSEDGGVLFVNVTPGVYTLSATKEGVDFESVVMTCQAGYLVNASPPYGLQALE
jgi:hypothetical protein